MTETFRAASTMNANIGCWDVSSVLTLRSTFNDASVMRADLAGWDVSKVREAVRLDALRCACHSRG
jgi:hypothetical protein